MILEYKMILESPGYVAIHWWYSFSPYCLKSTFQLMCKKKEKSYYKTGAYISTQARYVERKYRLKETIELIENIDYRT